MSMYLLIQQNVGDDPSFPGIDNLIESALPIEFWTADVQTRIRSDFGARSFGVN